MEGKKQFPVIRYENGEMTEDVDDVLIEYVLEIYIDGNLIVKLICMPEYLEELVLGYMYTEAIITSPEEVEFIGVDMEKRQAFVTLKELPEDPQSTITVNTGDSELPYQPRVAKGLRPLSDVSWTPEMVMKNAHTLLNGSQLFKSTGNVHSSMLCRGEEILYFSEDVGRFNTVDKCVGKALKDGVDLSSTCIYVSCRLPSSLVTKIIRAGIPMVASRSATTDTAIQTAEKYNLTLVGFAKGHRMNLYVK